MMGSPMRVTDRWPLKRLGAGQLRAYKRALDDGVIRDARAIYFTLSQMVEITYGTDETEPDLRAWLRARQKETENV